MYKRTMTYTDYSEVERTEEFLFNLTQAECLELELGEAGGLAQMLTRIVAAQDMPTIVATFKKIILAAYGEKSPDGRRFIKSQELRDAFEQTPAYSDLFVELSTNAEAAAKFVNAIIPAEKIQPQGNITAFPQNVNK